MAEKLPMSKRMKEAYREARRGALLSAITGGALDVYIYSQSRVEAVKPEKKYTAEQCDKLTNFHITKLIGVQNRWPAH